MIAIGSDHGGFELKQHIMKHLDELGVAYKDFGTYTEDSVDYPDIAKAVAEPIAANKIHGIRAALCCDVYSAKMCRQHNDANILCLGGRVTGRELAFLIVDTYLDETFAGDRHQNRINKIHALEK